MITANEAKERADSVEHSAIARLNSGSEEENAKTIFEVAAEAINQVSSDGHTEVNIIITWNNYEVNLDGRDIIIRLEDLGYSAAFNEYKCNSQTNDNMLTLCISW